MDKWHIGRGGQTSGPYPWAQIVAMAAAGQIAPTDLLWQEGTTQWLPASGFAGLLSRGPAAPAGRAVDKVAIGGLPILLHAKRAAEWNLHNLQVTEPETKELLERGVDDEDARKFHAWRRSVLALTFAMGLVGAALGSIKALASPEEGLTDLGKFLEFLRVATLWVIPIYAFIAGRTWSRHKRSRRQLTIGWTIAFLSPLVLALVPAHWRYQGAEGGGEAVALLRLVGAIASYITLMPAVLALIPGIMRACLRIKVLLPQSIVPGWFLVGAAPFWMFIFLVVFVTINQLAGDVMLIFGVLAVTTAPILYLVHVSLFTRPILEQADQEKLLKIQRQVRVILIIGVAFMVLWLYTGEVFGKKIVGFEEATSMIRPWSLDLWSFPIEYAAHSFFTMALAADLFMAMNLSVWLYTKEFVASPAARDYDRRMAEINEAGSKD